ncbi:DUF3035 domain-containing protein [Sphingomonas lutea]|uniref:DUF3035 domain-containing protein n=1 Tax=Sphingomonas lutea TaxID=1045317 RepID=A0A7G9SJR0_9SPHN|nr:DUF3035 domain-containing protein [Sphingomonas lutea]QNN68085.1 DUF3035 domain-containing protein [Sphingomonas lutea]
MRNAFSALVLGAAAISTAGCASLTGRQAAPDEFAVARNAPLIIPPDYTLAPPVAGTVTTTNDVQQQAIDAIFGGPAPRSMGEMSLLDQAGRDSAQIGIRSTAWDPDTRIVDKGPVTLSILAVPESNSEVASAQIQQ